MVMALAMKAGTSGLSAKGLEKVIGTMRAAPQALVRSARALIASMPELLKRFFEAVRKLCIELNGAHTRTTRAPLP
jgi:hypothetical protein